jgi:hypothetical protein
MSIKDELLKVYYNRTPDFQDIQDSCKGDDISGVLLMSPDESSAGQPFPFFVVGRETFGWKAFADVVSKEECEDMMCEYEDFKVGRYYYSSPFWNVIRKIEKVLGNKAYSCFWTNISKYDQACGTPDAKHEELFSAVDNLLIDEIRITAPKICIFFTSYRFDYRLKNIFEQVEFIEVDGFDLKTLCLLKHPSLPILTFRTYHPRYLRMRGWEESVIDFIGKQAKK